MGFFKQLSKDLKRQAKAHQAEKSKGLTDTTVQGDAPYPETGDPVIVTIQSGADIVLYVELDSSEKADRALLGRPKDDYVERSIRVRLLRDLNRTESARVLVETRTNEPIGLIAAEQSYFACELINQVGEAVAEQDPSLVGRAPHLDVSCRVEGEWEEVEWPDEPPEWEAHIELIEIRIKAPIGVTEIDG